MFHPKNKTQSSNFNHYMAPTPKDELAGIHQKEYAHRSVTVDHRITGRPSQARFQTKKKKNKPLAPLRCPLLLKFVLKYFFLNKTIF